MARILLAVFMTALVLGVVFGVPVVPEYTHMGPCDPGEYCPGHPDAECKLDCLFVDENGKGDDCIYHFYEDGNLVFCWM